MHSQPSLSVPRIWPINQRTSPAAFGTARTSIVSSLPTAYRKETRGSMSCSNTRFRSKDNSNGVRERCVRWYGRKGDAGIRRVPSELQNQLRECNLAVPAKLKSDPFFLLLDALTLRSHFLLHPNTKTIKSCPTGPCRHRSYPHSAFPRYLPNARTATSQPTIPLAGDLAPSTASATPGTFHFFSCPSQAFAPTCIPSPQHHHLHCK